MQDKIKIGCSGFYYKEWKGVFYPKEMAAKDWLAYYCQHFNTLELNSSFYKMPTLQSLQNWHAKTPEGFTFAVKAPKLITHLKRFNVEKQTVSDFYDAILEGLQEKCGCFLFQLPPSFLYSEERLALMLEKLDGKQENVVEFRHKSWWQPQVFKALAAAGITFCGQSYPGDIPEKVVQQKGIVYYRFHGKPVLYKSLYTRETLEQVWAQIKKPYKKAYLYFNNTWGESAIINARQLQQIAGV